MLPQVKLFNSHSQLNQGFLRYFRCPLVLQRLDYLLDLECTVAQHAEHLSKWWLISLGGTVGASLVFFHYDLNGRIDVLHRQVNPVCPYYQSILKLPVQPSRRQKIALTPNLLSL